MHHLSFGDDTGFGARKLEPRSPMTMVLEARYRTAAVSAALRPSPSASTPSPVAAQTSRAALMMSTREPSADDGVQCNNPVCVFTSTGLVPGDDSSLVCSACGSVVVGPRRDDTADGTTGKIARNAQGFAEDDCHGDYGAPPLEELGLSVPPPHESPAAFQLATYDSDEEGGGGGGGVSVAPSKKEKLAMKTAMRKIRGAGRVQSRQNPTARRRAAVAKRKADTTEQATRDIVTIITRLLETSDKSLVLTEARSVLSQLKAAEGGWTEAAVVKVVADQILSLTFQKKVPKKSQHVLVGLLHNNDTFHVYVAVAIFALAQRTKVDKAEFKNAADSVRLAMKAVDGSLSPQRKSRPGIVKLDKAATPVDGADSKFSRQLFASIVTCVALLVGEIERKHHFGKAVLMEKRRAAATQMALLASSPAPTPLLVPEISTGDGAGAGAGAGVKKRAGKGKEKKRKKKRRRVSEDEEEDDGPYRHWKIEYVPVSRITTPGAESCSTGSTKRHYAAVSLDGVTVVAPWFAIHPLARDVNLSVLAPGVQSLVTVISKADKILGGLLETTPMFDACGGAMTASTHLVVLSILSSIVSSHCTSMTESTSVAVMALLYYVLVLPESVELPKDATVTQSSSAERRKAGNRTCVFDARPVMFDVLDAICAVVAGRTQTTVVSKTREVIIAMNAVSPEEDTTGLVASVIGPLLTWFTNSFKRTHTSPDV